MKKRRWSKNELIDAVHRSTSIRQVICKLGLIPAGGNYYQIKKYLQEYDISNRHFKGKGWNKGLRGIGKPRIALADILKKDSMYQSYKLKRRLFAAELKYPACEQCGWAKTTTDGRLPLELDHISGDPHDNRLINLRILCPNCHSLKPTHRGKNRKKK